MPHTPIASEETAFTPGASFAEQHAFALAARTNPTDSASKTFTHGATT